MFISELFIENFRIFGEGENALTLPLKPGLTALVGENDTGKTAIIDALRLALGTTDQEFFRITDSDLHQVPKNAETPKAIRIRCKFEDLVCSEQAALVEYLTFEARGSKRIPVLYINWTADVTGRGARRRGFAMVEVKSGPEGDGPRLETEVREHLCATYMRPLRDAERSLAAGRGSRLSGILENTPGIKFGEDYKDSSTQDHSKLSIVGIGRLADDLLSRHVGVREADTQLNTNYLEHLSFSGTSLKAHIEVGGTDRSVDVQLRQMLEKLDLHLHEGPLKPSLMKPGLGSNNLLFMACELLLLGDEKDIFPLLLIEEPEAHLHPQRQLLLMRFLQEKATQIRNGKSPVQVIVTTHSPNLASAIHVENLALLHRGKAFVLAPSFTKLSQTDYKFLDRFLDVTKANMFFARGLMIVEGDAENILVPTIATLLGRDLSKNGVSIVNVGGTGLSRFARIYQRKNTKEKLEIPVACVTDMDVMPDCAPEIIGKVKSGEEWPQRQKRQWRAKKDFPGAELENRRNEIKARASGQSVETFVSDEWTLEYDLGFSRLAEPLWIAVNLAKFDDQIDAGKSFRTVVREARRTYKALEKKCPTKEHLACEIYAEFITRGRVSKATAAQYLASLLEILQKSRRYRQPTAELRKLFPTYLVDAIDFVTRNNEVLDQSTGNN